MDIREHVGNSSTITSVDFVNSENWPGNEFSGSVGLGWEVVSFHWCFRTVGCTISLLVKWWQQHRALYSGSFRLFVLILSLLWAIPGAFHCKVHISRQYPPTPESTSFLHLLPNGYTTPSRGKLFLPYCLFLWALIKTSWRYKSLLHYYDDDSGGDPHSTPSSPRSHWKNSHILRLQQDVVCWMRLTFT